MNGVVLAAAVLLFVAAFVGWWVTSRRRRAARSAAYMQLAQARNFRYAAADGLDTLQEPFDLFTTGDDRGIDDIVWGTDADGVPVRLFDFWYMVRHHNGRTTTEEYHRFTCVLAELGTRWPHLIVRPESALHGIRDALGFPDIQLESDEFNRRFDVRCTDARFASAFLDPRMMQFLLGSASDVRLEVGGTWLLTTVNRVDIDDLTRLLAFAHDVRAQIPAVVHDLFR
jgi:hypothetical protein